MLWCLILKTYILSLQEIKEFPAVNPQEIDEELRKLVSWGKYFKKFWTSSSYHLDDSRQGAESKLPFPKPFLFIQRTDLASVLEVE